MKLKVHNIKLNDRSFTEKAVFKMFIPAAKHNDKLIGWLAEYCTTTEQTIDEAILCYIRTAVFYGSTTLTYDVRVLVGKDAEDAEAIDDTQLFCADMFDQPYDTFNLVEFDLILPAEVILDDASFMFTDLDETLDQAIFEALLYNLKFNISNIR